jgi:hypothetical protein
VGLKEDNCGEHVVKSTKNSWNLHSEKTANALVEWAVGGQNVNIYLLIKNNE